MSDQFFPQSEVPKSEVPKSETPTDTPVEVPEKTPELQPTPVIHEPTALHEPPALPSLPPSTVGPSQLARDAHKHTRKILAIIVGAIALVIVILSLLIWQLNKEPAAPSSSNTVAVNTPSATETPSPTLNEQLPGSNSSSAGTAGWPAMTTDFVKNLTYPTPTDWATVNGWKDGPPRFTLANGVSRFEAGWYRADEQSDRILIRLTVFVKDEAIGTGDIDGDGLADAVAILKWTDGGTGAFPLLYTVFGNQPYSPTLNRDVLASIVGGSYSAQKVELSARTLRLQLSYPKSGDASCCWTGQANVTLRLVNGQWET
jgi:hypothetical protein